jgi:hypothetical protein
MIFARADFVGVHSAFWETDNFRFQFLLSFAPGHEFLHCDNHYFFDRPSILIRDLSQQSHRPLREGLTTSAKPVGVGKSSQPLIPTGERSGLLTRIATTESASLCVPMKS